MIVSQVLMMEDIIHGNRDLLTDLLEEFQVHFAIGLFLYTRKSHGSQASYSRGQRNKAKRIHAVFLHMPNDLGPTTFFGKIHYEDRLLRLPHQSGRAFIDRPLMTAHKIGRDIRLDTVQSHGIPRRIVQRQGNEIDMHHSGKALGKILAKRVEIAVDGDRLRNLQQRLVPLGKSFTGRCGMRFHGRASMDYWSVTSQEAAGC